MKNIKYIQLEPAAFLTDIDFQMMDAEQRGVYCSIIFYLYCNGGIIELSDNTPITLLQDKYKKLAVISGCYKTGPDWTAIWSKIAHKFQITDNMLTHKRVTEELKKAEKFRITKQKAGLESAKKRWGDNTPITKERKLKLSKEKKSKEKKSKELKKDFSKRDLALILNKKALEFDNKLKALFGVLTKQETVTFANIRAFLIGQNDPALLDKAIDWAMESKKWIDDYNLDNIAAKKCFVNKIKKNTGYKPKG